MSAPDITREVMQHFAQLTGDSHLTILLGAGASASVGLPTWDTFASRVAVASGVVPSSESAALLLTKQDPTIVLQAANQRSGSRWPKILTQSLYGENLIEPSTPSSLHLAAAGHYFASEGSTTLATLNFDTLLESALLSDDSKVVMISMDAQLANDEPTVHHLHGLISASQVVDPIVGFKEFADLVASDSPWQRTFLSNALSNGPLLIAGTSYRDPDIRHWLHLILRDESPIHPALVTLVREGLSLSREDFEALSDALVAEWQAIGLQALTLHDLADVALVIRELRHAHVPDYRTPNERAAHLWAQHSRRFAKLQREYSRQLTRDASDIGEAMGTSAFRGTLWLADAKGKLARWASDSGIYSGIRQLKRVPSGHDSPWIAGEAIGTEAVKLRDVERETKVSPTWRSVLAIPIFVGDRRFPDFASAVLTFGLPNNARTLLERQQDWQSTVETLSTSWGTRLSTVAFSSLES